MVPVKKKDLTGAISQVDACLSYPTNLPIMDNTTYSKGNVAWSLVFGTFQLPPKGTSQIRYSGAHNSLVPASSPLIVVDAIDILMRDLSLILLHSIIDNRCHENAS